MRIPFVPRLLTKEELEYQKNMSEEDKKVLLTSYSKMCETSKQIISLVSYEDYEKACIRIRSNMLKKKHGKVYAMAEKIGNATLKALDKKDKVV